MQVWVKPLKFRKQSVKEKKAAARNLVAVPFDDNNSIPHDFIGKFGSANVLLKKAPEGTGIIAGGPARSVLELAGYKNIRTKSLGSNNKTNVVLATLAGIMRNQDTLKKLQNSVVNL